MELYPLILVTISAVLHLGWNTIVKQADNKFMTLMVVVYMISITGSITVALTYDIKSIPLKGWGFVTLSGAIHAVYYWFLTKSYTASDLSFTYPYTRGFGALIATCGGILFLNEMPSWLGGAGIAIIVLTILIEPLCSQAKNTLSKITRQEVTFIAMTALAIGSYLVVDTFGVRTMPAWVYLIGMKTASAIILLPLILRIDNWQGAAKTSLKPALYGAGFLFLSYVLTLMAMEIAPVAYVASARALGIIVSGLVGVFILKELLTKARLISIALISLGILLIGLS